MPRPVPGDYAEYYHGYIERVPDGDIVAFLDAQRVELCDFVRSMDESMGDFRYAEGKWTVKEVVGHVIDCERVFGCRALVFARGDRSPMPSMEQDDYVASGNFAARTLGDLADEFDALRSSHVVLFRSFGDEVWARRGTASGFEFTTNAIAWILAGHALHHAGVLEERYL